jgi:hypothetical protein
VQSFFCLDNKFVEAYYANKYNFSEDEKDLLEQEEFLHLSKLISKDLGYLLSLPFVSFWGVITKMPELMKFLDEFLQNIRKYNDVYKLSLENSQTGDGKDLHTIDNDIKKTMNRILDQVLRVFIRLSFSMESETEYFSM